MTCKTETMPISETLKNSVLVLLKEFNLEIQMDKKHRDQEIINLV
jgi:hypothetical protein